jgi:D-inositol-3-phosphate glycosyltransferase
VEIKPAENPEARSLRARVHELGLDEQILFVPSQSQEQMPLFYNAADVVTMPSRYESFGLAALEAQACGTPVVASRVGGLPFAVQDGCSGLLVEQGQPQELAGALARLLDDPALRRKLGQQAAVRAEQFGWRAVADNVIATYQDLLVPATAREKLAGSLV